MILVLFALLSSIILRLTGGCIQDLIESAFKFILLKWAFTASLQFYLYAGFESALIFGIHGSHDGMN